MTVLKTKIHSVRLNKTDSNYFTTETGEIYDSMDLDYCFIKKSEKSSHLRMIGISFFAQAFCNERDLETQQNASVCRCSVFSFLLGTIVKFKVKDYYPVTQVSIFFGKKMEDA